jgi:NADPH-dependent 2,4-dienoyl-CoA reductase/sulfur reductase-like enzyme
VTGPVLPRRALLAGSLALGLARPAIAQARPRVVVVGGGFAGAIAARALVRLGVEATLVDPAAATGAGYVACPFSNLVLGGLRTMADQRFGYDGVRRAGVAVVPLAAAGVDATARRVRLADGTDLPYDRLILAPGVEMNFAALPGYDAAAAEILPHAWKAGAQTELLARQLDAMPDGGTVLMAVPPVPYRCPPGPYERASLIAHYLKTRKPRSKLIVLDAKDQFSKQRLFEEAWTALYPGTLEWVGQSLGGRVTEVDVAGRTLVTEFDRHRGDVINVIPPQRAGAIAAAAGVADRSGWCPVEPVGFESRLVPGVHVIGDAAIMGAMPKSAFAAADQARVCARAVATLLAGGTPATPKLANTCWSVVAPDYGISVAGVYRPGPTGLLTDIEGAGGTSPVGAAPAVRVTEAAHAASWFDGITADAFG